MDSPAKFLWSYASLCFVCPVYSRGELVCEVFLASYPSHPWRPAASAFRVCLASSQGHPDWTSLSSFSLENCSSSALSVPHVHLNITVSEQYLVVGILLTCWAYQVASVFQQKVHLLCQFSCSKQSLYVPRRSALLCSFPLFHLTWTRTNQYMLFPPENKTCYLY